jgi:hypothetical protein
MYPQFWKHLDVDFIFFAPWYHKKTLLLTKKCETPIARYFKAFEC